MRLIGTDRPTLRADSAITVAALALVAVGCTGTNSSAKTPTAATLKEPGDDESLKREPPPPEDVVVKAARPLSGYRPVDDKTFGEESLLTHLAAADGICVGERHDQVIDHYAQLRVLEGLSERRAMRGFELGLAMEMVRSEEQPTLSAYQEGLITGEDFEGLANWKDEWGFPIQYYRPHMEFARDSGVDLLALGVARDFTKSVAKWGFSGIDEVDSAQLPEIDENVAAHRGLFDALMDGHPMEEGQADNYYAAQLVWDEAMAEASAAWLAERTPGRKLIIMAGTAHCHRTAIPARIKRRTGFQIVSLLPVDEGVARKVSDSPSTAEEHVVAGYDYQMVFSR